MSPRAPVGARGRPRGWEASLRPPSDPRPGPAQAEVEQKKKRTFRKFTYRGVDLDQLLDMS